MTAPGSWQTVPDVTLAAVLELLEAARQGAERVGRPVNDVLADLADFARSRYTGRRPADPEVAAELVRAAACIEAAGGLDGEHATPAVLAVVQPLLAGDVPVTAADVAAALRRAAGPGDVELRVGVAEVFGARTTHNHTRWRNDDGAWQPSECPPGCPFASPKEPGS